MTEFAKETIATSPDELKRIVNGYLYRCGDTRKEEIFVQLAGLLRDLPGAAQTFEQAYAGYQAMYLALYTQGLDLDKAFSEIYLEKLQNQMVGHATRANLVPVEADIDFLRELFELNSLGRSLEPKHLGFAHCQLGVLLRGKGEFMAAINHLQEAELLLSSESGDYVYAANATRQQALCFQALSHETPLYLDNAIETAQRCVEWAKKAVEVTSIEQYQ